MSNSLDLTSVPSMSNSDTAPRGASSETSTGLNYQQALAQVKCLDLIYFKKNSSSVSPAPSSSKTRDSKYSHAGIIVNSEVLPGVAGMRTGSYYVLQTSGPGDVSSGDGSVAPAPDSGDITLEGGSGGRSIKYYGVHLTELGTVLKRYTNPDLSTGVAWARFKENPLIQGANESSSKYKKRKKTLISQIEQFYQKSKARNLGRKIFGLMRKSHKRPEGLKFSHHILHTGSTYNSHGQNWSTHPIEQFYQHLGWLQIPEDSSEASEDPESASVVDPATVPVDSGVDVNWAAPTDPSTTGTTPPVGGDPSTTGTTDPSTAPPTGGVPSTPGTSDPSATPPVGGTPSTTATTDPSTTGTTDSSSEEVDPSTVDSPTITGTVDNLNTIVDPPTDVYCAPTDRFEDDGDYQDPDAADPSTPTETVDGADPTATTPPVGGGSSASALPVGGDAATTTSSSTPLVGVAPSTTTTSSPTTVAPVAGTTGSSAATDLSTSTSSSVIADPSATARSTDTDASTTSVAPITSANPTTRSSTSDASGDSSAPPTAGAPTVTPTASASMVDSNSSTAAPSAGGASTPKYAAAPSTETEYW